MTIPPNLFNYATSELSQDAAIMWLLEWAKPIHKDRNFKLHQLGLSLLKSFYNLHSVSLSDFEDIEIQPQVKKIDILVLVIHGDYKTAILIEDKINVKTNDADGGVILGKDNQAKLKVDSSGRFLINLKEKGSAIKALNFPSPK